MRVAVRHRHDAGVPTYRLSHHHDARECAAAFAAWRGFQSPLRHHATTGSCRLGGHELWWDVEAPDAAAALELLPRYVAQRTVAIAVGEVPIP